MKVMPPRTHPPEQPSKQYSLTEHGDIIEVALRGKMLGETIKELGEAVTHLAGEMRAKGKRPLVLADVSTLRIADSTSSARREGRRMLADMPVDRAAIFGRAHIGMLMDYMTRAAGVGTKVRYFSDKSAAFRWLRGETSPKPPRSSIGLAVGGILLLIGILALIGWHTDNSYLMRLLPSLRPMNPVAAVGLLALGCGFLSYWLRAFRAVRTLGYFGIALGIAALLPLGIDTLLYGTAVHAVGEHTQLADSAAACFILSGALGLLAGRTGKWIQPAEYTLAGVMGAIAVFNIYGQLYAHDFIYNITDSFVMALNLALAFLLASVGMIILIILRRVKGALYRITRTGWLIVIALLFVQVATYGAWAQAKDHKASESAQAFSAKTNDISEQVNTRLQAYVNALHGFRGLFAASTNVSQGDFDAYYASLNLTESNPGLRSIAFITAVKTSQLATFTAERRADNSLIAGGNPQFTIQNQTAEPLHFIATYVAGVRTSNSFGLDLTSLPGRSTIYNQALQSTGHYSSGTITFPASTAQPAAKGFFIATPVRTAKSQNPIGVVSANFNYSDFFGAVIRAIDDRALTISVTDDATGELIYTSGRPQAASELPPALFNISLAQNQSWQVRVQAPANFGVSASQDQLANVILFAGQLFALLLAGIFVLQIRARGQALALVDTVTEDLQHERDNIAALHKKDEAMLAGIGEGLIVVDRYGKIEITNAAATQLLGYSAQEMLGKNVLTILQATDEKGQSIPEAERPFSVALKQAKSVTTTLHYTRKDGRQIPVKLNVAPILLHDQLIGTIEVFSDITREKQFEHMKDEFLSVASHELRTPMGAIRANLSMILDGDYGPVNKGLVEPLGDMKDSTIRLVELVNDLLNVARIEAGRMHFALSDFSVAEATRSVVSSLAPLGKEKNVRVTLAAKTADMQVQADIDKFKQVLTNLIGNSLKFTDSGTITVAITKQADTAEIAVTDTGIGITPEDQQKLFGKFNQITSAQAGKPPGTGLGLYISREIVRKMGGDMSIKASAPGSGSTFAFTIPRSGSAAADTAKQAVQREAELHPDQK